MKNILKYAIVSAALTYIVIPMIALYGHAIDDGKKMFTYQRYKTAKMIFTNVIKEEKVKAKYLEVAFYYLGQIEIILHKRSEAKTIYQEGLKRVPGSALLMIGLGQVLLGEGKEQEGKLLFDNALQQTKYKNMPVIVAVINAYAFSKVGDVNYILEKIKLIPERINKTADFYMALGDLYKRRLNDGNKTYTNYQEALSKNNNLPEADYKLAKLYLSQKNREGFLHSLNTSIEKDHKYAPSYYELYAYYYDIDVNRAKDYFLRYKANTDSSAQVAFEEISILYASKNYKDALEKTLAMIAHDKDNADIRCYRLLGYTYNKLGDFTKAKENLQLFFAKADAINPDIILPNNYELMGEILATQFQDKEKEALYYYTKAFNADTALHYKLSISRSIVDLCKKKNDFKTATEWLHIRYELKPKPKQYDIFNWGFTAMQDENYVLGDSIFSLFAQKYPNEIYGYFWQAKAKSYLDSSMVTAIPLYKKAIEIGTISPDSSKLQNIILQSLQALYAYERKNKNYEDALMILDKMLLMEKNQNNEELKSERQILADYIDKLKKHAEKMKRYEEKKRQQALLKQK